MNAIDLLKEDHRKVDALFAQFKENENGTNGALFKKIRNELVVHTHIEETIFYPELLKRGKKDLKQIVREGLEEHGQVKMFLGQLENMTPRSKAFNPKLKVIVEDVEHHVQEEEGEMFDLAEEQLTSARLEALGKEMEAEKVRMQKKLGIKPEPAPKGMLDSMMEATKDLLTGAFLSSDEPKRAANGRSKKKADSHGNGKSSSKAAKTKAGSEGGKKSGSKRASSSSGRASSKSSGKSASR